MTNDEVKALMGRKLLFDMMQLPGQPMMMHMGTSYLIADFASAVMTLATDLAAALDREAALREALEWYGEQARLCRLVHSEGDAGRHALSDDGGQRARAALGSKP